MPHIPVLLNEIVKDIPIPEGGVLVDGTLGSAGHSKAIALSSGAAITLVGLDKDEKAIEVATENLKGLSSKIILKKSDYRNFGKVLSDVGITEIDGFLLDLGFSSNQIENSGRGFSFQIDEPLLMTLDSNPTEDALTASFIVNNWDEENIETIIRNYGEEKHSKRIAKYIVEARKEQPITTSVQLSEIVQRAVRRTGKVHPATKTFQALRITVNDELGALRDTLPVALKFLKPGGRLSVISFHSLEDRIVKNFGKDENEKNTLKILHKKPVVATEEEIATNPRARSAKLRTFEKLIISQNQ